jgi:uncharacterized membrane protein SirB2
MDLATRRNRERITNGLMGIVNTCVLLIGIDLIAVGKGTKHWWLWAQGGWLVIALAIVMAIVLLGSYREYRAELKEIE